MHCSLDSFHCRENDEDTDAAYQWCAPPVDQLVQESGKLVFLVQLLDHLKSNGHQTLVFSQSRKMLDIIEKVLNEKVCFGNTMYQLKSKHKTYKFGTGVA